MVRTAALRVVQGEALVKPTILQTLDWLAAWAKEPGGAMKDHSQVLLDFIKGEVNLCGERGRMLREMEKFTACRPAVRDFAIGMEAKLAKNDHKRDWADLPIAALVRRLENEVAELKMAIDYETPDAVAKECHDVANFALMIGDVAARKAQHGGDPAAVPAIR